MFQGGHIYRLVNFSKLFISILLLLLLCPFFIIIIIIIIIKYTT